MISLNKLTYNINGKTLFKDLSMTFLPSSVVCLYGSNGSGKTTLLRIIAGLQKPTNGYILYSSNLGNHCTYIGHQLGVKLNLTVLENIKFWTKIYQSGVNFVTAINYFNLTDVLRFRVHELSIGNQKKVALTRLILCNSNIWLLDEIEAHLDEKNRSLLFELIIKKSKENGIIITSSNENDSKITNCKINLENFKVI